LNNLSLLALYVVGFIAIFYFLAIRPQQKQRRAHDTLVSSVKKGDRIVSVGGLFGTVRRVDDASVMMEVAKGVQIQLARRAIAEIVSDPAAGRAATPEPGEAKALEPAVDAEPSDDATSDDVTS
jgi:preprotein translocase subunit YajC